MADGTVGHPAERVKRPLRVARYTEAVRYWVLSRPHVGRRTVGGSAVADHFSEREIKRAVTERYGARAREALATQPVDGGSADACCEPASDGAVAAGTAALTLEVIGGDDAAACCGTDGCGVHGDHEEGRFGATLYQPDDLGEVPEAAQLAAAGCGNPVAIAELRPGEAVLDLGSGGGIDCFLAARQVGEDGEVWGLDMTPDMVQLARSNAEQVDVANVRFRLGEIEDIPFAEQRFDVLISNCVINLSPDKRQVFREAFRVLRPGGRLRVSDIVLTKELPDEQRRDLEQWAGCIAGALPVEEYLDGIRDAGFVDVSAEYDDTRDATNDGGDGDRGIASAYVSALRPA